MNYYRKINNKIMWQVYDKLIHDFIRKKKDSDIIRIRFFIKNLPFLK